MDQTRARAGKRRNAAATRARILESAREAFARSGYDGAGVREIAGAACVTAMLVNRYFGSKEKLFAEVVASTLESPVILTAEVLGSAEPGRAIAEALVDLTRKGSTPLDGFLVMHRSGGSEVAAKINRKQIERHHQKTMTRALEGEHAAERAAIVLAIVAGVQMMRQTIRLSALTRTDRQTLVDLLAPLLQRLIDGASR